MKSWLLMVNLFVAYCQFKVSNLIAQEYKTTADDACIPIKSESEDHKNIKASSPKISSMNNIRLYNHQSFWCTEMLSANADQQTKKRQHSVIDDESEQTNSEDVWRLTSKI